MLCCFGRYLANQVHHDLQTIVTCAFPCRNAIARNRATFHHAGQCCFACDVGSAFNARRTMPFGTAFKAKQTTPSSRHCVSSNICCICAIAAMALPNQPPRTAAGRWLRNHQLQRIAPGSLGTIVCASGVGRLRMLVVPVVEQSQGDWQILFRNIAKQNPARCLGKSTKPPVAKRGN